MKWCKDCMTERQGLLCEIKRNRTKTFGPTYEEARDGERIHRQMDVILDYMLKIFPRWQTHKEIQRGIKAITGRKFPTPSISAQLRHLRKKQFGGYEVAKKRRTGGLWEYLLYPKNGD